MTHKPELYLSLARDYATAIWTDKDQSIIDHLFAKTFKLSSANGVEVFGDQAKIQLKAINENWLTAFPDLNVIWDEETCESLDQQRVKVTHNWQAKGRFTHRFTRHRADDLLIYEPNNVVVEYAGSTSYVFDENNHIIAYDAVLIDSERFYQQLGETALQTS